MAAGEIPKRLNEPSPVYDRIASLLALGTPKALGRAVFGPPE